MNYRVRDYIEVGNLIGQSLTPVRKFKEVGKALGLDRHNAKALCNLALGKVVCALNEQVSNKQPIVCRKADRKPTVNV